MKTKKSILASILFLASVCGQLNAATLIVTTTNNSGAGSLRDQVAAASSGDSIVFDNSIDGIPIVLVSGNIVIDKNLTVSGNGIINTIIDGNNQMSIIKISNGNFNVTIQGLTIRNGYLYNFQNGGGLVNLSSGIVNIDHCLFFSCLAGNDGGAMWTNGFTLNITACTFDDNYASGGGGGIMAWDGIVNIEGCTFLANSAATGGGIKRGLNADVTITNTTFSGNSTFSRGGAFYGKMKLINCTVANNHAGYRGGGGSMDFIDSLGAEITNCIIYGNTSDNFSPDFDGYLISDGHNIIGDTSGILSVLSSTDLITDPLLNSLAYNGGPTKTFSISCGSPAIDAADSTTTGADQRGVAMFGGRRDIGAYEYECPALAASLAGYSVVCAIAHETYSTESGMSNYSWIISGTVHIDYDIIFGGSSSDDVINISWLTGGNHTVTVSYTNPGYPCCTVTSASLITRASNPFAPTIHGPYNTCVNETVTYYINLPQDVITFNLDVAAPSSDYIIVSGGNVNDTSITIQWLTQNPKVITVFALYDGFCSQTGSFVAFVNPGLVSQITGNEEICSGSSTTLDAGNFYHYLWSTAETTQTISVSTPGNYNVTVSNSFGCSASSSFTVNQLPPVNVSISGNLTFCSANFTLLNAGSFASYSWSTGATTQVINVNTAGNFSVTVTNDDGCTGTSSVTTIVNPVPHPVINGNLSICAGSSTTLSVGTFASYLWSTGATTQSISVNTAGNYSVTVTNSNGCSGLSTVTTVVNPNPSCNITGNSTACFGSSTQWCAPVSSAYTWSNGATTQCVTLNTTGNYSVTTTSVKGCSSTCSKQLTVGSQLTIDAGSNKVVYKGYPDSACVTLTAIGAGGGTPPYTLTWTGGSHANSIAVCPTVSTTYYLTITDANNCSTRDSVRVCLLDVRCGNGNKKVTICHGTGSATNPFVTLCIDPADARWHFINHPGEKLGTCGMVKTCGFPTHREAAEDFMEGEDVEMGLMIYPNPATSEFTVSFNSEEDGKYLLRLVSMTGQILLSEMKDVIAGENKYIVNLQDVEPGIYLVLMQEGENIMQARILKQ